MMAATIKPSDVPDLPLHPFQPKNIQFPYRSFGKSAPVKRSFQAGWFQRFNWLHYDSTSDSARCFTCSKAVKDGRAVTNGVTEQAFLVKTKDYDTKSPQQLNGSLYSQGQSDSLDLMNIAREFVAGREGRLRMFGDC